MNAKERIAALLGRTLPPFVLCYHGVGTPADRRDVNGLFVSREQFVAQLGLIEQTGYRLTTVSDLAARVARGTARGWGAVTFDDAFAQTDAVALAELAARGLPSTLYVAPGLLGGPHPHMAGERIMDAAAVRARADAGVEIGGHTVGHVNLLEVDRATALGELRDCREQLEQLVGRPVRSLAYPFGVYDEETTRQAAAAGFETACACSGSHRWQPLAIPREPVFPSTNALRLRLKLSGHYAVAHRLLALRRRLRR